jgi:hypothetical protein
VANLSTAHEKVLNDARSVFRYADSHRSIMDWRVKAREDYGFFDGTRQWPESVLADLRARGQDPVVVNKIKNLVNYMSGIEIQTRVRTAFRPHSNKPEHELLAKALTHKVYYDQERLDMPHWDSYKFKDSLITGIGWSNIFNEKSAIDYEYVNPFNIIYDADDLSPELTDMDYVIRLRWLSLDRAIKLWPTKRKYFESMFAGNTVLKKSSELSGEISCRINGFQDIYSAGNGSFGSKILIVELQKRNTKTAYCGFDYQGHYFETFNEEEAEQLTPNKKEIEEKEATQIMRTVFTQECLLENAPLNPNIPNLKDFTYIPTLWSRRFEDGVPEGWISVMKDIQRESNYRRAKLIDDLSSVRIFVDPVAVEGQSAQEVLVNLRRSGSVNFISGVKENIIIDDNAKLSGPQFQMLQHTDQELQQVSGIHDDALGKTTNATSGVAIQNRQINSVRNQVFAFDNFKNMKKRTGQMFLALIQGGGEEFIEARILDDDEQESIILNLSREVNGKKVMFNDIRTLPLGIEVEEVPDFTSSLDEQKVALENLMQNPRAEMIMQSEGLMKQLKIRGYKDIAKEMRAITQQNQPQQKLPSPGGSNLGQMQQDILAPEQEVI